MHVLGLHTPESMEEFDDIYILSWTMVDDLCCNMFKNVLCFSCLPFIMFTLGHVCFFGRLICLLSYICFLNV